MKRAITFLVAIMIVMTVSAQSSIDKLFNKYQGEEGFVTVTINGSLLKLLGELDEEEDEDLLKFADKFTSIRILAQEEDDMEVENFYDMVNDELERGGYEEMMRVNSSDADVKILVKQEGNIFKEFLVVAGGDDNAIIQIKGNLTYEEVKEMSASIDKDDPLHHIDF